MFTSGLLANVLLSGLIISPWAHACCRANLGSIMGQSKMTGCEGMKMKRYLVALTRSCLEALRAGQHARG